MILMHAQSMEEIRQVSNAERRAEWSYKYILAERDESHVVEHGEQDVVTDDAKV
jgi:hypothetical protein